MTGPDWDDFHSRIARLEKARAKGHGFEAKGTLGRSYYSRRSRRRPAFLGPLLIVLICGFSLKGVIHFKIGAGIYDARVERLMSGEGFDRLGGVLMQADPATLFISDRLRRFLG